MPRLVQFETRPPIQRFVAPLVAIGTVAGIGVAVQLAPSCRRQ